MGGGDVRGKRKERGERRRGARSRVWFRRRRTFSRRDRPSLAGEPLSHVGDDWACVFIRGYSACRVLTVVGWRPRPWGGVQKKKFYAFFF